VELAARLADVKLDDFKALNPSANKPGDPGRRHAADPAALGQRHNIPPRMLIRAGSVVLAPRTAKTENDVAPHVADNGQLSLAPEVVTRRTVIKARKGDSVASIARRYKLSAAQVADWNDVGASAAFKLGQQIVVYLPVRATAKSQHRATRPAARGKAVIQKKPRR
jgi:membrane-bound lytic murein transglycosylase D